MTDKVMEQITRIEGIKRELLNCAHGCGDFNFYERNLAALEANAWGIYQERYGSEFKYD